MSAFPELVSGRRPVAVVSFAQYDNVRREDAHNEVEMLMPVVAEVFGNIGITKDDVGFICSGSTDYLVGGPFSFVAALDAVGVWPPRAESHVEMDGAWALYEAWVLLQEGEIDAALVYSFGRSSLGDLSEILAVQLDPYYLAPLWPDPTSLAALQAQAMIDKGTATEADFAAVASRSRRSALANPKAQVAYDRSPDELLAEDYEVAPLRRHALPPLTDGCAAVVLAAGERAYELCERPAFITGIDHRIETHSLGARDLTVSPSTKLAGEKAGVGAKKVDVAELHAPFAHQEMILVEALGLGDGVGRQPLGRRPGGQPDDVGRPHPHRRVGPGHLVRPGRPGRGPRHLGAVPAAEPGVRPGGGELMAERCAVIGIGQTVAKSKREDVSIAGLVREAALVALEDAGLGFADIDAVVIGKAPDMFEGVMMPELYLAPALGAVGKPMFRVHTAGSVGGSTAIVASHLVASGMHERVLTVAFEKQSDSDAMWALSVPQPFSAPLLAGAGGYFAPIIRAYMYRSGAPRDIGMMVAVKDRLHALEEPLRAPPPARHLHEDGGGVDHAVGPAALPRVVPVLRRRRRDGHRVGEGGGCGHGDDGSATGVDPRHGHALGADDVRRPGPGQPAGRTGLRRRPVPPGRHHQPAGRLRHGRGLRALQLVRADVAREPRLLRRGRRLEAHPGRGDVDDRGRRHPVELLGRRAVLQPDRRLGDAPLPRDGAAGAGPGGRAPGARRPPGPRAGLRWWLPVLRHVGGRGRQALSRRARPVCSAEPTPALTRRSP